MCHMPINDKEMYILHSKMHNYKRKVDKAIDIAGKALVGANKPLLSFSGGKDSIVMLDICVRAGFQGELVLFKYGICTDKETPLETLQIAKHYAEKHSLKLNIIECLGEFDCWNELGYFCLFPESKEERRIFNKTNNDFRKKSVEFEKNYGCDVSFIGMRKAESKRRKMTLIKNGSTYQTGLRPSLTCCPIANFTGADIWAYVFSNCLLYPSYYDYPHESREMLRNEPTLLFSDSVVRYGHAQTFKAIFPEYIAEIKNRYPEAVI